MLTEKIDKNSKDIVFVYTICGNMEEARAMGISVIKEKLAISMDYWPINSIYPWNNIIQEIEQFMLMFSTQRVLSEKLIKHIEASHSYNIPMVVRTDTDMTNLPYYLWVDNTLEDDQKIVEKDLNDEEGIGNHLK